MLKEGDLVRYYTLDHAYYGASELNADIGIVINTTPVFANNSAYMWYIILLGGKIRTAREDDIFKLGIDKHV